MTSARCTSVMGCKEAHTRPHRVPTFPTALQRVPSLRSAGRSGDIWSEYPHSLRFGPHNPLCPLCGGSMDGQVGCSDCEQTAIKKDRLGRTCPICFSVLILKPSLGALLNLLPTFLQFAQVWGKVSHFKPICSIPNKVFKARLFDSINFQQSGVDGNNDCAKRHKHCSKCWGDEDTLAIKNSSSQGYCHDIVAGCPKQILNHFPVCRS